MVKLGIIIVIALLAFGCYSIMASASRMSRMEEQYLRELEQK